MLRPLSTTVCVAILLLLVLSDYASAFVLPSSSSIVTTHHHSPTRTRKYSNSPQQQQSLLHRSTTVSIISPPATTTFASLRQYNSYFSYNNNPSLIQRYASSEESSSAENEEETKNGIGSKIKNYFGGNKKEDDDGLTFRQKLAKMGLATVLSYGWVSNMSYAICMSIAWYAFGVKTGKSPLYPGQWKPFLAVYAGFYVFNNIVRPLRFALSVAVAPYLDNVVKFTQTRLGVSKGVAIGLTVFLVNVVGTISLMSAGITLASLLAGIPIFPPKNIV